MRRLKFIIVLALLIFFKGTSYAQTQATTHSAVSQGELEQILAPIALYPDIVLSHILIAATYPLEVVQAQRWSAENEDLNGSDAVQAVANKNWDPSVRALVAFPRILERMSADLDWTQRLGEAFLNDEALLLASVQTLRQRAYDAGSFDDMEKASISRDSGSIVIQPIEREVVYVPYYDSRKVYGEWPWSRYSPVYWDSPYYTGYRGSRLYSSFYWGPRTDISFGFFFNTLHWHNRHIVRIPYQHYRPRQYYNHYQITRHQRARRWQHNRYHRRGVGYRNSQVRRHYSNGVKRGGNLRDQVRSRVIQNRDSLANRHANRSSQTVKTSRRDTSALPRQTRQQQRATYSRHTKHGNQRRAQDRRVAVQERVNRNDVKKRTSSSPRTEYSSNDNKKTSKSNKSNVRRTISKASKDVRRSMKSRFSKSDRKRN